MISNFEDLINDKKFLNTTLNYDHVIIGTGPSATILVNHLVKKKKNILVIEKGNFSQKKYQKINSKQFEIKEKSRTFIVGGTSSDWSQISSYFESFEMNEKKVNKKNLWPLSHIKLKSFYNELEPKYKFNYSKLKKKKLAIPFNTRFFFSPKIPLNFKKFYQNINFDLIYNCNVDFIDEEDKFVNLILSNQKKKILINVKNLIVCAGGLETTGLILKSLKKGFLKKLRNKKFVGKYFMEHPKAYVGIIKYPKHEIIKKIKLISDNMGIKYYGISLEEPFQKKNKLLNSYIRFEKMNSKTTNILNLFSANKDNILLRAFFEMEPKYTNQISIDHKGYLISKFDIGKKEITTLNILIKKIFEYFSKKPYLENVNLIKDKNNLVDASHHMGGLIYPKVVDKNLKLQGLNRIYCCSSAIFPTSGSVNPTMTICALALRLAKHFSS